MQYNPTVNDRSGEILAAGRMDAARSNAQMLGQLGEDIGGTIRSAGQAAAGFAMGGPAGAAMAMQGGGGGGGRGGSAAQPESVIGSFISAYADNKALEAKGEAYGDFMKRHGQQLGFDPTYLDDFLKKPKRDQAMIGDQIIGLSGGGGGNRMMSLNHLNRQAELYPGRGAGGGGAAAGGGDYVVGQGWTGN
jgi:hypothetical protein